MKNKKDGKEPGTNVENGKDNCGKSRFYAGAAACVAGAVAFGLSFTLLGIYALISSIIIEIGALCFLRIQIKKNPFKAAFCFYVTAYVLLAAFAVFFICGIIFSGL